MVKELSKLIHEYASTNKKIDPDFILEVVNIGVCAYDIEDYISGIIPINTNNFGAYSLDKLVRINLDLLNEKCLGDENKFKLSEIENSYRKYINVVQTILHELEHAKQYKKITHIEKNLETMVLISSLPAERIIMDKNDKTLDDIPKTMKESYFKEQFEIYKKYYKYAPEERMAEIDSRKECLKIINYLLDKNSRFSLMYRYMIYNLYLKGYENNVIPTKLYLEKRGYLELWEPIDRFSRNYSYLDRARTGTKLTNLEKEQIKTEKELILKQGVRHV